MSLARILQIIVGLIALLLLAYGAALGAGFMAPKWVAILAAVLGAVGSALRAGILGPIDERPYAPPPAGGQP